MQSRKRCTMKKLFLLLFLVGCTNSNQADDVDDVQQDLSAPAPCGVWVDVDTVAADARALSGEAPDAIVFTKGHTTCVDAIHIGDLYWPNRYSVRYVFQDYRAEQAR
jgi:hypothetical protein